MFASICSLVTSLRFFFLNKRSSSSFKEINSGSAGSKFPPKPSRVFCRVFFSSSAKIISSSFTLVKAKITSSRAVLSRLPVSTLLSSASLVLISARRSLAMRDKTVSFWKSSLSSIS